MYQINNYKNALPAGRLIPIVSKYPNKIVTLGLLGKYPVSRKENRREETVTPTTSGYNLRPRSGKRLEFRPTIERKTQQGGPVQSRKGRGRNDSPYIEERTRSNNRNVRRGGDQQSHIKIMFDRSPFANPTHVAHVHISRDVVPRQVPS
ncbi:uncharacterized protein TNCV_4920241 [Trichonephila clavipes]|nr:uncharacterized protein TNCV_4920241 [Trichonephila clavipes]